MAESRATSRLESIPELDVRTRSVTVADGVEFALAHSGANRRLAVLAPAGSPRLAEFEGDAGKTSHGTFLLGSASARNAEALRSALPWLRPGTLGLRTSAGFGDRLGEATPGHVRALRAVGGDIAPIFPQQSIREMERTGRSPQEVMDDAMWGVFSEGWQKGFGADADHLKTTGDISSCVAAGYTFFTFDPGEYVDDRAESAKENELRDAFEGLPWSELEDSPEDLKKRYSDETLDIEGHEVRLDERTLVKAAVKYGRAVAHVAKMHRRLEKTVSGRDFEVEVSVDETGSPTTHAQHVYIVGELRRMGVEWVSLAPRYVGRFEKGVDYIGDAGEFERDFAVHAAIARAFGPYKLSLHSGSDKFGIYPAVMRQTGGLVHLKTAGTSYLEALRAVADLAPDFFRRVYAFSRDRYETDRASYHVSASLDAAPEERSVDDANLPALLDQFDAREIMHVTFGSVLRDEGFRDRLMGLLRARPEAYAFNLESHFLRHLEPFSTGGST